MHLLAYRPSINNNLATVLVCLILVTQLAGWCMLSIKVQCFFWVFFYMYTKANTKTTLRSSWYSRTDCLFESVLILISLTTLNNSVPVLWWILKPDWNPTQKYLVEYKYLPVSKHFFLKKAIRVFSCQGMNGETRGAYLVTALTHWTFTWFLTWVQTAHINQTIAEFHLAIGQAITALTLTSYS